MTPVSSSFRGFGIVYKIKGTTSPAESSFFKTIRMA